MPVIRPRDTSMIRRRRLLGLVALLAVVLAVIVLWQRPNPFSSNETVHAVLADADGLAPIGADVRVAGVPVGKVTAVTRDGRDALLTMTVARSGGEIHRDATVSLQPRLMFEGTAYAALTLGSPSAPPLGNATIPVSHTSTYVPLDDALSALDTPARADVHAISTAVAGMLSARAPGELRDAIATAPTLTAGATTVAAAARGSTATELREAVGSLSHVAMSVSSRAPALRDAIGTAGTTLSAVNDRADAPLDETLRTLPALTAQLRTGASSAATIAQRSQVLIGELQPGVAQLDATLDVVRPLLREATPVMQALAPELGEAETAFLGAQRGAAPALGAIRALEPTLQIFQSTLLGALESKTDLGTPAYLSFLGLFAGGGGASRPFGVDGAGHFMRFGLRFITGAGQPLPPCTLLQKAAPPLAAALERAGGCTP